MEAEGFKPGTHAWLARQSGALAIAPRLLLYEIVEKVEI